MSYSIGYVEDVRRMAQEVRDCEARIKEEVSALLSEFQKLGEEKKDEVNALRGFTQQLIEGLKKEREDASRAWREIVVSRGKKGKVHAAKTGR